MALLHIKDLNFSYPHETALALKNINLEVQKGEFLLLCGPSGCGKTTLLRHIKPSLEPVGKKNGKVFFNGVETGRIEQREAAAKIGLIMQNPESQIVTETVRHELAFGLECLGIHPPLIAKRIAETVSYFGIEELYNKKNNELSGGEKQLVSIAAITAMRPELILLDEPASQLDPIAARNLYDLLMRMNAELGITVILSEHRIEDVFAIAGRVVLMNQSELVFQNSPKQAALFMAESNDERVSAMLPIPAKIYKDISCLTMTNQVENLLSQKTSFSPTEIPVTVRDVKPWFEAMANKHLILPPKSCESTALFEHKTIDSKDTKDKLKKQQNHCIQLDSLYFRFEKNTEDVIRNLSLKINKGEILSIVGGNGAGKTTLLRLICEIIKPYSGKIKFLQKELSIAYLPQNPQSMFAYDTVLEDLQNVEGGLTGAQRFLKSTGLTAAKDSAVSPKLKSIIDRLGIQAIIDKHPFDLSFGELQRAALAMLLLKTPNVLLLDEPTKGLDTLTKKKIAELLKSLCADGLSVVAVTHDIEFAAEYSQSCAMLFDGRILNVETPEKFFSGNMSYTTVAHRIAGNIFFDTITCEGSEYEMERIRNTTLTNAMTVAAVAICAVLLVFYAFKNKSGYALISVLMISLFIVPFFLSFERRKPKARDVVPIAVMAALGTVGRIAFAMVAGVKPTTAIVIISGVAFGPQAGFLTGAVSALASNFFFGQGAWTPWQMLAWGLCGLFAGLFKNIGAIKGTKSLIVYGIFAGILFGLIMNCWHIIGFVSPITRGAVLTTLLASFYYDLTHVISTAVFLLLLGNMWLKKLERIKTKFGVMQTA